MSTPIFCVMPARVIRRTVIATCLTPAGLSSLLLVISALSILTGCSKSSGKTQTAPPDSLKFISVSFVGTNAISPPSQAQFFHAATWGSKIVFACGVDAYSSAYSDTAYIYDTASRQWSKAKLSAAHTGGAVVACNGKIFLAGGDSGSIIIPTPTAAVDIYDVSSNQWTTARLSSARDEIAGAAAGNTVVFGSGPQNNTIDIFDMSAGQWSTGRLSVPRTNSAVVAAGTKVVFAGGYLVSGPGTTDAVDIYDVSTKLWSTARLSVPRFAISGAAAGNKIVLAGGENIGFSSAVDIYDAGTGEWTASTLSGPGHSYSTAVSSGNLMLFAAGIVALPQDSVTGTYYPNIDVYNVATGVWGYTPLQTAVPEVTGAAAGSQVLFAYRSLTNGFQDSVENYHLQ